MDVPSDAIEAMNRAIIRSKRTSSVHFPIEYVRRAGASIPTAARLVKSHEIRLKLHMTLVMQATKAPYTLPKRQTRYLAQSLNLDPKTGPSRVNTALKWLNEIQLVTPVQLPDGRPGVLLLHPDGSGIEWEGRGRRWVGVPFTLWSNMWILRLSGIAIVVLMALLELNGGSTHPQGELMDGYRKKQYGLSDDTWTRATQELELFGLLQMTDVYWGDDEFPIRKRKRYLVLRDALDNTPDWSIEAR
ncbi:hypothetical protein [Nesterenkonia rhizosphaerae]|uniref:Uncharacterized protein n=1 Tax=Nesterenkonia rhizosphaerae TaxID=1348272 RepID=A0ABP9FWA0_9MICC